MLSEVPPRGPFAEASLACSVQSWQGLMRMTQRVPSFSGRAGLYGKMHVDTLTSLHAECYLGGTGGICHQVPIMAGYAKQPPLILVCPCNPECSEYCRRQGEEIELASESQDMGSIGTVAQWRNFTVHTL